MNSAHTIVHVRQTQVGANLLGSRKTLFGAVGWTDEDGRTAIVTRT